MQKRVNHNEATNLSNKIVTRFGECAEVEDAIYYAFPTPEKLAYINVEEIRHCGLSWRKAECIKGISDKVANGTFNPENLGIFSNEQVVEALKKSRGVGTWTADGVSCGFEEKCHGSKRRHWGSKDAFTILF